MTYRRLFVKFGAAMVTLGVAMSIGGPVTRAAAQPIVVALTNPATGCGSYDGDPAVTNPVTAISGAVSGQTVVICPGTYSLSGTITISGKKKVTIKRAATDPGNKPILTIDPAAAAGIDVSGTTGLTIDGLVLDGRGHGAGNYRGIKLDNSSAVIKNSGLIGPNVTGSHGIELDASGQSTVFTLSVTNTTIAGYSNVGVRGMGPVKLTVTSSYLDATDGGRVSAVNPIGVHFLSSVGPIGPTGSVTKSRIVNNWAGVVIQGASKITISSNLLLDNTIGVGLVGDLRNSDNTNITGNTFLGIPATGSGVYVNALHANSYSIKKTAISKNSFAADTYTPSGTGAQGVRVVSNVSAPTQVTGTISGNTFWGFSKTPSPQAISFSNASLNQSGNDVTP